MPLTALYILAFFVVLERPAEAPHGPRTRKVSNEGEGEGEEGGDLSQSSKGKGEEPGRQALYVCVPPRA